LRESVVHAKTHRTTRDATTTRRRDDDDDARRRATITVPVRA
jgi:hypothetical protein